MVSGFLTVGVFERDIAHRRSVAVLCMLCKIGCSVHPLYVHPLYGTLCTLSMVPYMYPMCQCGLHAVLWSHIGIFMLILAAEPRSTAGLLFPSQCLCGTILPTVYAIVWDWPVSRAGPMLLHWPKLLDPFLSPICVPFLIFLYIGWNCGAGVFGLIWYCVSLSL